MKDFDFVDVMLLMLIGFVLALIFVDYLKPKTTTLEPYDLNTNTSVIEIMKEVEV